MKYYGIIGPQARLMSRDHDPIRGFSATQRWIGATSLGLAIEAGLRREGIKYHADYSTPGVATIDATVDHALDGSDKAASIQTQWRMTRNQFQRDIWEHPKVTAITDTFADLGAFLAFRRSVEDLLSSKPFDPEDENNAAAAEARVALQVWGEISPDIAMLIAHLALGKNSYDDHRYALRCVQTAPRGYVFAPNYGAENKTCTSAQLQAAEPTIPFVLLPGATWLALGYDLDQLADGRLQITREWWAIEPDAWFYDAALPTA